MNKKITLLVAALMIACCSLLLSTQSSSAFTEKMNATLKMEFNSINPKATLGSTMMAPAIAVNAVTTSPTCFGGSNGSVDITVSGGTAPYTYIWTNGATTQDIFNITAGNYTVSVTDAAGVVKTKPVTVAPAIVIQGFVDCSQVCFGSCNGIADLTVVSGTGPFTYHWSNNATTEDLTNLCAGVYSVTVKDANNCSKLISTQVQTYSQIVLNTVKTDLNCTGVCIGAIDLSVSGGTAPYSYNWSNGAFTQDLSGLCAGPYSVTVTDYNGCSKVKALSILQPTVLNLSLAPHALTCFEICSGIINTTVSGGTAPYTYNWSNGATIADLYNVCAGDYTLTVTDAKGCVKIASASVSQPSAPLAAEAIATHVNCNTACNGSIDVTVSGGTAPYTYLWINGATTEDRTELCQGTYCVTITDANQCSIIKCANVNQTIPPAISLSATNLVCNSVCSGEVNLNVISENAPFTYNWSNGATTKDISGVCAGNYCVTVYDVNGCSAADCITITQPTPIVITPSHTDNACSGYCFGTASVNADGGNAPYSFVWENGSTENAINGLCNGNYCVTVYDANQCSATICILISSPDVLNAETSSTNAGCFNTCNGTANVTPNGGTAPYSYVWSNGSNDASVNGLCAGEYCVTVYDSHQCSVVKCVSISQPDHLQSYIDCSHLLCHGDCNGIADLTVVGGTAPFTYLWNNGATTEDLSGLCAGLYCATVTDANGCAFTACQFVEEPTALTATASSTNVNCFNNCNGTASIVANGGTTPYTYIWSNGNINANLSGLCAGDYCVTVYDAHQCSIVKCVSISQPNELSAITSQTNNNCFQSCNGTASVSVTGGTAPYSYAWSNGNSNASMIGLCAGSYCVTVSDAHQCTIVKCITITEPTSLSAIIVGADATNGIYPNCNGSANLTVSGGTAPYTYMWSNGATTEDLSGLCPGTYSVTVMDAHQCPKIAVVTIYLNHTCNIQISGYILNIGCNANCNGSVNITVSNATSPTYHWSNGATTEDVSGLCAGSYSVTVTDAYLCTASQSFTVTQNSAIVITITSNNTTNCSGCCNGTASASASGGVAPYTYHWSTGVNCANITALCAGTYTVTVTDASGCTKTGTVTITCTPPCNLTLSGVVTNVSCNGGNNGSINFTVTGGSAYTYHWNTNATTEDISGLAAGNYSVTVTSAGGCSGVKSFTICQPTAICASVTGSNTCYGVCAGVADLSVSGGTCPYTYHWSNNATTQDLCGLCAGTYTVTVYDANLCSVVKTVCITQNAQIIVTITSTNNTNCSGGCCNGTANAVATGGTSPFTYHWSTGACTANITGLCAGTYTVTVIDAAGCTKTASVCITCVPPCSLTLSGVVTNVSCNGGNNGSIDFTVTGGSAYTYHWNNNATTQDISGLAAGSYSITVTSAGGCSGVKSFSVCQPTPICASVTGSNTCYGVCAGVADLSVSGGTCPYTYHWSNNAATQDLCGLCAGTYTVTVYDANLCSIVKSVCITQNAQIIVTITSTNTTNCSGCCNGTASAIASGGTSPFTYHWSTGACTANITGLCAGTYSVTVIDAAGCSKTGSVCIACVPPCVLTLSGVVTNVSCNGGNNGAIDLSVSGGTGAYTYHWNGGATTQDRTCLSTGTYSVTVTSASGCSGTASFCVGQPTAICGSICGTNTCIGQSTGAADLTVSGGTSPYTYHWSNGSTHQDITCLCAGIYCVTITDAHNCTLVKSVTICAVVCGCGGKVEDQPLTLTSSSNTELNLNIFPNPVTSKTTFEFVASQDVNGTLELYSVTGALIAELYKGELKAGDKYSFSYNADELAAGMYLARLATNNGAVVQNIMKIQ